MRLSPLLPAALASCTFHVSLGPTDSGSAADRGCATASLDAAGGEIALGDVVLTVPAGALSAPTTLSVCPAEAPTDVVPLSTVVSLEPADLVLAAPVTLLLPHEVADGAAPFLADAAGVASRVMRAAEGGDATAATLYAFGTAWVAVDPRELEVHTGTAQTDLLFVLDPSASMMDERIGLSQAFDAAFPTLLASAVDYHVGVVTMDLDNPGAGELREASGVAWIDIATPDAADVFAELVTVGSSGSGQEQGLGAAYVALEELGDTANAGFRRSGARLAVAAVSDEDDSTQSSVITPTEFLDWFEDEPPTSLDTAFHGYVPPGTAYVDIATDTGGTWVDVGSGDAELFLDDLFASLGPAYALQAAPDAATIEVWAISAETEIAPYPLVPTYDALTNAVSVDLTGLTGDDLVAVLYVAAP